MIADVSTSLGTDFYLLDELLTDEERQIRDRVREFCDREVIPVMNEYWDKAEFPFEMIPKFAELNIAGGSIEGYDCPGMSNLAVGLVAIELARGDGSLNTFFGVHSGLAMGTIEMLGNEEQKQKWLPAMARMEKIGAFGLTEPEHGSDIVMLETSAVRDGDEYVINGEKRWIGNASFADVIIIWARDEEGNVGGFLVEKGAGGPLHGGHDRQDGQAGRMAGQCKARGRQGPARRPAGVRPQLQGHLEGAHRDPLRRRLGGHRARGGLLRGGAQLHQGA